MNENHKIDFAKKKGATDEWYTPVEAVKPIIDFIPKDSIVWCPFDTNESNFVKELQKRGVAVIHSHIDENKDFFKFEPVEYDYIVSNPPYSIRNDILKRLFELDKPFAMLMNTNGLFDSKIRWDMFINNQFTLFYLKGRVNYMREYGKVEKSSPPFQSAYICSQMFRERIMFQGEE